MKAMLLSDFVQIRRTLVSTLLIGVLVYSTFAQISTREGRAQRRRDKEARREQKRARGSSKHMAKKSVKA